MQRFAGVAATELEPVLQAEGKGRLVGGWQQSGKTPALSTGPICFLDLRLCLGKHHKNLSAVWHKKKLFHIMPAYI